MEAEERYRAVADNLEEVYVRVIPFIRTRAKLFCGLPPGYSEPEEILHEVVRRFLEGDRNWDPEVVGLIPFLKNAAKSLLSVNGLYGKEKNKPLSMVDPDAEPLPKYALDAQWSPEEILLRWECVLAEVQDDPELVDYVECCQAEFSEPAAAAEVMSVDIERIYELRRKLKEKGPSIRRRLNELLLDPHE